MADNNMNKPQNPNQNQTNETMQREQAKATVAGERKPEQGKKDEDRREQGRDKDGGEKSAIGGGEKSSQSPTGQTGSQTGSQTGEPGRSRSELDQNREFDKSRTEPTSR